LGTSTSLAIVAIMPHSPLGPEQPAYGATVFVRIPAGAERGPVAGSRVGVPVTKVAEIVLKTAYARGLCERDMVTIREGPNHTRVIIAKPWKLIREAQRDSRWPADISPAGRA
jgi:hypothetical protein